jgi:hypothetical protein
MAVNLKILRNLFFAVFALFTFSFISPVYSHGHAGEHHDLSKENAPQVQLSVKKDSLGGFNIHIITKNFIWKPDSASGFYVEGEGHAHLYVDETKIARVYGEWFHLDTQPYGIKAGKHNLIASLNGNDHVIYTIEGVAISATQEIEIPQEESSTNKFPMGLFTAIISAAVIVIGLLVSKRKNSQKL